MLISRQSLTTYAPTARARIYPAASDPCLTGVIKAGEKHRRLFLRVILTSHSTVLWTLLLALMKFLFSVRGAAGLRFLVGTANIGRTEMTPVVTHLNEANPVYSPVDRKQC